MNSSKICYNKMEVKQAEFFMEKEEIRKILNKLIVNISPEESFEGKSIVEDLDFDSVSLMQLVMEIEEMFGASLNQVLFWSY